MALSTRTPTRFHLSTHATYTTKPHIKSKTPHSDLYSPGSFSDTDTDTDSDSDPDAYSGACVYACDTQEYVYFALGTTCHQDLYPRRATRLVVSRPKKTVRRVPRKKIHWPDATNAPALARFYDTQIAGLARAHATLADGGGQFCGGEQARAARTRCHPGAEHLNDSDSERGYAQPILPDGGAAGEAATATTSATTANIISFSISHASNGADAARVPATGAGYMPGTPRRGRTNGSLSAGSGNAGLKAVQQQMQTQLRMMKGLGARAVSEA